MAAAGTLPITVVIPLGGIGSRFQNEGHFARPKPFVRVFGKEMILWVLDNLALSEADELVICFNPSWMCLGTWMREVVRGSYPRAHLVELSGPTRGAAETVLLALRGVPAEVRKRPVMLCDGDTFYTYDIVSAFRSVAKMQNASFVFHDSQPKPIYSYCVLGPNREILETKEKVKISDWANTGCYCFRDGERLVAECEELLRIGEMQMSQDKLPEFYTSGVIARMLSQGEPFRGLEVPAADIHVLGTPAQVADWCRSRGAPRRAHFSVCISSLRARTTQTASADEALAFCREVVRQGHLLTVIADARGAEQREAAEWLKRRGIDYHHLEFGGSAATCDFLIRAGAIDPLLGTLDRQTGFYHGGSVSPASPDTGTEVQGSLMRRRDSGGDVLGGDSGRDRLAWFALGLALGACAGAAAGRALQGSR